MKTALDEARDTGKSLVVFKENVGNTYARKDDVNKEMNRVFDQLTRIDQKLDRLIEHKS